MCAFKRSSRRESPKREEAATTSPPRSGPTHPRDAVFVAPPDGLDGPEDRHKPSSRASKTAWRSTIKQGSFVASRLARVRTALLLEATAIRDAGGRPGLQCQRPLASGMFLVQSSVFKEGPCPVAENAPPYRDGSLQDFGAWRQSVRTYTEHPSASMSRGAAPMRDAPLKSGRRATRLARPAATGST